MTRPTKRASRRSAILAGNPAEVSPDEDTAPTEDTTQEQPAPATAEGEQTSTRRATTRGKGAARSRGQAKTSTGAASEPTKRPRRSRSKVSAESAAQAVETQASETREPAEESSTGAATNKPERASTGKAPTVLTPTSVSEGQRMSLILHPEDAEMLQLARVKDKADANVRLRALLACYRADQRLRAKVDRLARAARERPRPR